MDKTNGKRLNWLKDGYMRNSETLAKLASYKVLEVLKKPCQDALEVLKPGVKYPNCQLQLSVLHTPHPTTLEIRGFQ
jgi:hypothetical protein